MNGFSPLNAQLRSPRVQLADFTPAVLRFDDGQRASGMVQVLSLTGGLLSLPTPVHQGSQVKLLFLTRTGPVLGAAEMLSPVTSTQQPFRFLSLAVDDCRRLGAAIQSSLNLNSTKQNAVENQWMEKLKAASIAEKQPHARILRLVVGALAVGMLCLGGIVYLVQAHALK